MNFRVIICVGAAVALSGCESAPKPEPYETTPPKTKAEYCQRGGRLLGDPYLAEWQKLALYEKMRNKGCMD
jgi:hypothetical protein